MSAKYEIVKHDSKFYLEKDGVRVKNQKGVELSSTKSVPLMWANDELEGVTERYTSACSSMVEVLNYIDTTEATKQDLLKKQLKVFKEATSKKDEWLYLGTNNNIMRALAKIHEENLGALLRKFTFEQLCVVDLMLNTYPAQLVKHILTDMIAEVVLLETYHFNKKVTKKVAHYADDKGLIEIDNMTEWMNELEQTIDIIRAFSM